MFELQLLVYVLDLLGRLIRLLGCRNPHLPELVHGVAGRRDRTRQLLEAVRRFERRLRQPLGPSQRCSCILLGAPNVSSNLPGKPGLTGTARRWCREHGTDITGSPNT
jgi:hypothetical protein